MASPVAAPEGQPLLRLPRPLQEHETQRIRILIFIGICTAVALLVFGMTKFLQHEQTTPPTIISHVTTNSTLMKLWTARASVEHIVSTTPKHHKKHRRKKMIRASCEQWRLDYIGPLSVLDCTPWVKIVWATYKKRPMPQPYACTPVQDAACAAAAVAAVTVCAGCGFVPPLACPPCEAMFLSVGCGCVSCVSNNQDLGC